MARIAVIGAGAIGCFYGAQFAFAGHDVRLLLRRDAERLARDGLRLRQTPTDHVAGTARREVRLTGRDLRFCRNAADIADGGLDWTLVAVKEPALAHGRELLGPAADAVRGVVVLCNGLEVEERLAGVVAARRVFGMLCFVCVNRLDDGVIEHRAHGRVTIGNLLDDGAAVASLGELVDSAGIRCDRAACLREARWLKLAWNIPFNGLSVVGASTGVDTARILADPRLRADAEALIRETAAVANADLAAHGTPPRLDADTLVPELIARTAQMGEYLTSTLVDHRAGRPLELEALFLRPLEAARRARIPTPRLEALVTALRRATR